MSQLSIMTIEPFNGALGVSEQALRDMGAALAQKSQSWEGLSTNDLKGALAPYSPEDRQVIVAAFVAAGGDPGRIGGAIDSLAWDEREGKLKTGGAVFGVLSTVSMAASAYHGYKRNESVGWALWWGLMGALFPVITPVIGVAQGFGKPK